MMPEELRRVRRENVQTEGLPSDNNHDPSNILYAEGLYWLWFTQHRNDRPYDHYADCKIMVTTSPDGYRWSEARDALLPDAGGAWDDAGVLTANVTAFDGRFYMFYTGVRRGYDQHASGEGWHCGIAVAERPAGPFVRMHDHPVLTQGPDGAWDDRDSDDVTALFHDGKWRVYYKGNCQTTRDADDTKVGVVFADHIDGPYTRCEASPLIRGHAFAVWRYKRGFLMLTGLKHDDTGRVYGDDWHDPMGAQYLYYSDDGLHFEPCAPFENRACGVFCPSDPAERDDITKYWGVSVNTRDRHYRRYIERFNFALDQ